MTLSCFLEPLLNEHWMNDVSDTPPLPLTQAQEKTTRG